MNALPLSPCGPDWSALEKKMMGNTDLLVRLLGAVLADHVETPERFAAAIAAEELETLAFLAHQIKGVAGNLVAPALCERAAAAEKAARARSSDALPLAGKLSQELPPFFAALRARLGQQ